MPHIPQAFAENTFTAEVLNSTQSVLVDFWAPWCAPCRVVSPIVDELAREYGDRVKVGKVNIDQNEALAFKYDIISIPALVVFKDGRPMSKQVGVVPKATIADMLDEAIAAASKAAPPKAA
ncbi:MAG: thioredoxin [Cyanobacteria bacterium J06648_11]